MFSLFEFLQHATAKINVILADGSAASGTGFFFQYSFLGDATATVLVTNKHVIEGAVRGVIRITAQLPGEQKPNFDDINDIAISDFETLWIKHPEDDTDLCILPFSTFFIQLGKIGKSACFAPLREHNLPDYNNIDIYKPTEDIYMVGYPNGLADEKNNLPLVRSGITATPFYLDHNGIAEFMVDCACFPGSSGSPVLIVNEGSYSLHKQPLQAGNRMILLGILYAGPQYNAEGIIQKYNVPVTNTVLTDIPMNLGYCIPSIKLMDFKPLLLTKMAEEPK